ncbi:S8 family serine peptidase [Mangrovibacterium marinum]|nr:S8 family serine peptidase [Mangrovibacterium marinum]
MKKIYLLPLLALGLFVASCSDNSIVAELNDSDGKLAPVIDVPVGAKQGELLIKFKASTLAATEPGQLKSARINRTALGCLAVDTVLTRIGTSKLERVFPVDQRTEALTQETGLSQWYVVRFDENTDLQQVANSFAARGEVEKVQYSRTIQRSYQPGIRATSPGAATQAALDGSNNTTAFFNDPGLAAQWGYVNKGRLLPYGTLNSFGEQIVQAVQGVDVGCEQAWELCTGDPSVIVAVMDEGVMWNHPDLKANMWVNEGEVYGSDEDADGNGYAGDRYGYNFVDDIGIISFNGTYDTGHGTHVAGTIAAVNGNGLGVSGIAGGDGTANSGVKIMSCQVFAGAGGVSMYEEAKAIKYAADNGAVVLQCSWGYNSGLANMLMYTPGFTEDGDWVDGAPLEKEAMDYFIHNAGSPNGVIDGGIVVFAAGNEYAAMAGYPGAYPDYISVAAVAADGTPSSYSNYAAGVRIAAPGGDSEYHKCDEGKIYSTIPPLDGEYYGFMEGTSMACPHVSGVVALGLSYASKLQKHFRAADFRQLVLQSVSDASLESYFQDTKTYYSNYAYYGSVSPMQMEPANYAGEMGSGLINAYKLLKAVEGAGVELRVPNMFVSVNEQTTINYARFFADGKNLTFDCTIEDTSVATMSSSDQLNFTLTGLKSGSTKATVTASNGTSQEFYITVRKTDGWL